jgi:hypothetical protein
MAPGISTTPRGAWVLIVVSVIAKDLSKRFEKSSTNIFQSYIFLLARPEQKNVGQEAMDRSVLKSSTGGQKHDQSLALLALHNEVEFWMKTWKD